jgi:hypothetical protein
MTMSKIVKLHTITEELPEEERLRVVAQRALAPPDLPFDGLHLEAAMILNQMRFVTTLNDAQVKLSEVPTAQSRKIIRHSGKRTDLQFAETTRRST